MRNIKKYKLNSDYTTNKESFEYPTVSYVEENTNVYYQKNQRIVTYTTTGTSQQIQLVRQKDYLDYCKIVDTGEELTVTGTGALNHTFENPGEHQVELKFKDDARTLLYGFSGCTELTNIPANLFSNCTAVTDFSNIFYNCRKLTSIPSNLFSNNTEVTYFSWAFFNCSRLTSIPENLFSNNKAVIDFSNTFYNCSQLTGSIPENLFSNNTAVIKFNYTFHNCRKLTGSIPTDTDGTPIYNRSGEGKDGYAVVTDYTDCFYNCTGLTDYNSIPENWK